MPPTLSRALMASAHTLAPSPSLPLPAIHSSSSPVYTVVITISLILLLVCALGMHFLIRCVLRCSRRTDHGLEEERTTQMLGKKQVNVGKIELKLLPTAVYKTTPDARSKLPWPAAAAAAWGMQKERNTQCPICLSEFKDGEKIRVLPKCYHGFHVVCIDAWLCNHPNCPTCRHDLSAHASSTHKAGSESATSTFISFQHYPRLGL